MVICLLCARITTIEKDSRKRHVRVGGEEKVPSRGRDAHKLAIEDI